MKVSYSVVEITTGMICACMPLSVPLFRKLPSPKGTSFDSIGFWLRSYLPFARCHSGGSSDRERFSLHSYLPTLPPRGDSITMTRVTPKTPHLGYWDIDPALQGATWVSQPVLTITHGSP